MNHSFLQQILWSEGENSIALRNPTECLVRVVKRARFWPIIARPDSPTWDKVADSITGQRLVA